MVNNTAVVSRVNYVLLLLCTEKYGSSRAHVQRLTYVIIMMMNNAVWRDRQPANWPIAPSLAMDAFIPYIPHISAPPLPTHLLPFPVTEPTQWAIVPQSDAIFLYAVPVRRNCQISGEAGRYARQRHWRRFLRVSTSCYSLSATKH